MSVCLSSHLHLSSHVSLSSYMSLLLSRSLCSTFFLFSMTMTMSARPVGSLCTHGPQSAWVLAHSLSGEHVRIMQETFVQVFLCKPRATWNEVGLYLC